MTYNGDGTVSSVFIVRIDGSLVPVEAWGATIDALPSNADQALGTSILAVVFANLVVLFGTFRLTK